MCPRCRREGLHPTGGFWLCNVCGLAITGQALAFEQHGWKKSGLWETAPSYQADRTEAEATEPVAFPCESA